MSLFIKIHKNIVLDMDMHSIGDGRSRKNQEIVKLIYFIAASGNANNIFLFGSLNFLA